VRNVTWCLRAVRYGGGMTTTIVLSLLEWQMLHDLNDEPVQALIDAAQDYAGDMSAGRLIDSQPDYVLPGVLGERRRRP
jgi:hypothetical protein